MIDYSKIKKGRLELIDALPPGTNDLASALNAFADTMSVDTTSVHWHRAIRNVENNLFLAGRHYIDDIVLGRIARNLAGGDVSGLRDSLRSIPRPTNDFLGRYIETNVSLLTDNQPIARISPKTEQAEDVTAARLSELTYSFLNEHLQLGHKRRLLARIVLSCGVGWNEIVYDPTQPRHLPTPKTQTQKPQETTPQSITLGGTARPVYELDAQGRIQYEDAVQYGDITSTIVTPFEMHMPNVHWWNGNDMTWIMREYYTSIEALRSRYNVLKLGAKDGWYLERLDKVGPTTITSVQALPLWWWERLSQIVEGGGASIYAGNPEMWVDHVIVRIFDRKPNKEWPRGRTIITAGNQVIYDSPKEKGARAFDPRWPKRWHPYVIYRWEPLPSTDIFCRPLVTKLLPKIKRINAIDATMIMWRRTIPLAAWIVPKGAAPREGVWQGGVAQIWEYDPRRTNNQPPQPIYPPDFPAGILEERKTQIAEMEMIAGTEEIMRGQRPVGVRSAQMLDILRREVLASRSAILQGWDASMEEEAALLLQTVIRDIKDDPIFAERLRMIARGRYSYLTIDNFSGSLLSDNVDVEIDTASQALSSQEAKKTLAIEFLRYAPGLLSIPFPSLRQRIVEELGFGEGLSPQGPDIERARRMLAYLRKQQWKYLLPLEEDDPYVFLDVFVNELKSDAVFNMSNEQQQALFMLVRFYKNQVQMKELEAMQRQVMLAQAGVGGKGPQGGGAPPGQAPPGGEE